MNNEELASIVPEGIYDAKIISSEIKVTSSSKSIKYKKYHFKITRGRYKGDKVFATVFIRQDADLIDDVFAQPKSDSLSGFKINGIHMPKQIRVSVRTSAGGIHNYVDFPCLPKSKGDYLDV